MENFPGPLWYMAWPYVYTTITCSPVISAQLGSPPPALGEIWCIPWYGLFDPFCHFQKARWNKWSLPIGHHLYSSGWRQTAYHHAKGKGFNEGKILARWIRKKRHMDTHSLMQTMQRLGYCWLHLMAVQKNLSLPFHRATLTTALHADQIRT